jgi:hypothetical protein
MRLHQQAFKPDAKPHEPHKFDGLHPSLLRDADQWIAPAEAKASGFMEMLDGVPAFPLAAAVQSSAAPVPPVARPAEVMDRATVASADFSLPVGAWVELETSGSWVRTQLSWASPHGTLFLFTSVYGNTQSMTRRLRDKLLVTGAMRLVSGQPVVDGALDAVVQAAMLNSMEIKL